MTKLLPFVLLCGCTPGLSVDVLDGLRHQWGFTRSTNKGTAKVRVRVFDGDTALHFVADAPAPFQVHVRTVESPDGLVAFSSADWNDSVRSKTNAGFVSPVATLDWPVTPDDLDLYPGIWKFELGVVDADQAYVQNEVGIDVLAKQDDDTDAGVLVVNVVFTESLDDDPALRDAIQDAEDLWADIYAQIGIELVFRPFSYDADDLLPPAFSEEDRYVDIAAQTQARAVNLVLSRTIEGLDQIFGIAGDIPGPLVPTRRSAVQVATDFAAGGDGRFSEEEVRLLAETMAHETLHFLGLFHPVESDWGSWDVLGDTDECDNEADCRDSLGDNLMFPYPVCNDPNSCRPQSFVTGDQGAVVQRAVAVD